MDWIGLVRPHKVSYKVSYIVLDGDPAPHLKRAQTPTFRPMFVVAKRPDGSRWHWYECRPWPRPHCIAWGSSSPLLKKGHSPQFSAHVYCGETVAHLSYCWASWTYRYKVYTPWLQSDCISSTELVLQQHLYVTVEKAMKQQNISYCIVSITLKQDVTCWIT